MTASHPLKACRAARLPTNGLKALGRLRAKGGVRVVAAEPAWVMWENERPDIVSALLAVPGVDLFEPRDGHWYRPGDRLPEFDVPPLGDAVALDRAVVPAPFTPVPPDGREHDRIRLRLVRSDVARATSALRCRIDALRPWADSAPAAEIAAVRAAHCGEVAWLVGPKLPAISTVERFWGDRVLIPLGLRLEPDWSESALREAANVGPNEILVLTETGTEALSADALRPLTRAAIRRAR